MQKNVRRCKRNVRCPAKCRLTWQQAKFSLLGANQSHIGRISRRRNPTFHHDSYLQRETPMLTLTAILTVKAGQEVEFERVMQVAVPKVREEPGNHAYVLNRSTENPRVFLVYEEYEDAEALESHRAHLREMGIDLRDLLDGPPVLTFYDKLL